jgi:hypothetical protein
MGSMEILQGWVEGDWGRVGGYTEVRKEKSRVGVYNFFFD